MTIEDLVKEIPNILLYIVPGFVVQKIVEGFTPRRKAPQFETFLWSLFFSFLVSLLLGLVKWGISKLCNCDNSSITFFDSNNIKICSCIVLSIVLGFFIVKVTNSSLGKKIVKIFNPNMHPDEDVWFKAMKAKNGVWATVYLKNGMIYTGALTDFTSDPDDCAKQILLKQYRLAIRINMDAKNSEFCYEIENNEKNPNARVLIKYEDVISIQLID